VGLIYDTRDNPVSTKIGFYGAVNYENVSNIQSSKSGTSGLLLIDLRYFHLFYNSEFVLATRLSGGTLYGTPGYLFRYSLGGAERLRGYYSNRFRGNHYYCTQAEFRFPLYKRFSGVGFLDEGDITDERLNKMLVSYGAGIRFSINENVKLRLDYGIAKDQNGLFFTFGEAF
jgi:outer membrane protein assembly factor BamA